MGRQIVLSAHNLILFSNKQFQTSDTYGMDKSQKKMMFSARTWTKYIMYDSIYIKFYKIQSKLIKTGFF